MFNSRLLKLDDDCDNLTSLTQVEAKENAQNFVIVHYKWSTQACQGYHKKTCLTLLYGGLDMSNLAKTRVRVDFMVLVQLILQKRCILIL